MEKLITDERKIRVLTGILASCAFVNITVRACSKDVRLSSGAVLSQDQNPETKGMESPEIEYYMDILAGDNTEGRVVCTNGCEQAMLELAGFLELNEVMPFGESYEYTFLADVLKLEQTCVATNVAGYVPGKSSKFDNSPIIVGAHYDGVSPPPRLRNHHLSPTVNAANDNASGVIAVMSMAQYFAQHPTQRPMIFVLFSAEEYDYLGSEEFVNALSQRNIIPYIMLNFEMIGRPMNFKDERYSTFTITGEDLSNIDDVLERIVGTGGGFECAIPEIQENHLYERSDNWAFYSGFHIPTATITAAPRDNDDPCYHNACDKPSNLDFGHIEWISTVAIDFLEQVGNNQIQIELSKQ